MESIGENRSGGGGCTGCPAAATRAAGDQQQPTLADVISMLDAYDDAQQLLPLPTTKTSAVVTPAKQCNSGLSWNNNAGSEAVSARTSRCNGRPISDTPDKIARQNQRQADNEENNTSTEAVTNSKTTGIEVSSTKYTKKKSKSRAKKGEEDGAVVPNGVSKKGNGWRLQLPFTGLNGGTYICTTDDLEAAARGIIVAKKKQQEIGATAFISNEKYEADVKIIRKATKEAIMEANRGNPDKIITKNTKKTKCASGKSANKHCAKDATSNSPRERAKISPLPQGVTLTKKGRFQIQLTIPGRGRRHICALATLEEATLAVKIATVKLKKYIHSSCSDLSADTVVKDIRTASYGRVAFVQKLNRMDDLQMHRLKLVAADAAQAAINKLRTQASRKDIVATEDKATESDMDAVTTDETKMQVDAVVSDDTAAIEDNITKDDMEPTAIDELQKHTKDRAASNGDMATIEDMNEVHIVADDMKDMKPAPKDEVASNDIDARAIKNLQQYRERSTEEANDGMTTIVAATDDADATDTAVSTDTRLPNATKDGLRPIELFAVEHPPTAEDNTVASKNEVRSRDMEPTIIEKSQPYTKDHLATEGGTAAIENEIDRNDTKCVVGEEVSSDKNTVLIENKMQYREQRPTIAKDGRAAMTILEKLQLYANHCPVVERGIKEDVNYMEGLRDEDAKCDTCKEAKLEDYRSVDEDMTQLEDEAAKDDIEGSIVDLKTKDDTAEKTESKENIETAKDSMEVASDDPLLQGGDVFAISRILGRRYNAKRQHVEYPIWWKGYDEPREYTWEPAESLNLTSLAFVQQRWCGDKAFSGADIELNDPKVDFDRVEAYFDEMSKPVKKVKKSPRSSSKLHVAKKRKTAPISQESPSTWRQLTLKVRESSEAPVDSNGINHTADLDASLLDGSSVADIDIASIISPSNELGRSSSDSSTDISDGNTFSTSLKRKSDQITVGWDVGTWDKSIESSPW